MKEMASTFKWWGPDPTGDREFLEETCQHMFAVSCRGSFDNVIEVWYALFVLAVERPRYFPHAWKSYHAGMLIRQLRMESEGRYWLSSVLWYPVLGGIAIGGFVLTMLGYFGPLPEWVIWPSSAAAQIAALIMFVHRWGGPIAGFIWKRIRGAK